MSYKNSKIVVAIPTMDFKGAMILVESILSFEVKPIIYIINNSGHKEKSTFDYSVINNKKNIGVNASWNLAMDSLSTKDYHLCIMNDDVLIENDFFEKIERGFEILPNAGVICPLTNYISDDYLDDEARYICMNKREGWAFTIRNEVVEKIPEIPKELFTFFGDDWIFYHTNRSGWLWWKDISCKIKHAVGKTLRKNMHFRKKLSDEKVIYRKIMSKII